jgi:RimJ/RimL family protein N-acetyltransferase
MIIRPLKEEDAGSVYLNVKDPEIAKWTINIPHPYPKDGALSFIKKSHESLLKGLSFDLGLEMKIESKVIGIMALLNLDWKHKNAELGYWVGKKYWNKGLATEAAQKMVDFGFKRLKLHRISARCFLNNDASRRVMEKVGMLQEGVFRKEVCKEGEFIDLVYYAVLREEWE